MHSALPKVLHPLAGRPLVAYVVDTVRGLAPRAITIVVNQSDAVAAALTAPDLTFVTQHPPRGTGDAARIAVAAMPGDGITLVGLADVPLAPAAGLAAIVDHARRGDVGLLTARVPDPAGLGRIVRDTTGGVRAIVAPGHARGLQALLVSLPHSGSILIAGDAIDTAEHLERDLWTHCPDPETARESAKRLQQIAAQEDALLLYGHDAAQWQTLQLSPRFYD